MSDSRTQSQGTQQQFPPSKPQLPRELRKALKRTCPPNSMILSPFFSDIRHLMVTKEMDPNSKVPVSQFSDPSNPLLTAMLPEGPESHAHMDDCSYLHFAAMHGDVPLAHEAVRLGTSIGCTTNAGLSALYLGFSTLLGCVQGEHDVQVNVNSLAAEVLHIPGFPSSLYGLMLATMRRVLLFLLAHHADPDETYQGLSVLHLACMCNSWDLIEALLLHGANPFPSSFTTAGFTPQAYLRNPDEDGIRFLSLVSKYRDTPRPPRICPCGSGLPLKNCHAVAGGKPYVPEYICPCGSREIYSACCAKEPRMNYVEEWDEEKEQLVVVKQDIARPTDVGALRTEAGEDSSRSKRERKQMLKTEVGLATQMAVVSRGLQEDVMQQLVQTGRVDPAYAAACRQTGIQLLLPNFVSSMSKVEWKQLMEQWNEAVDDYIASGVDKRPGEAIENAAKRGAKGGPLYRKCEALGCTKVEGRNCVRMLVCSGCSRTVYCGRECQRLDWSRHKPPCRAGKVVVQMLPSQREHLAADTKMAAVRRVVVSLLKIAEINVVRGRIHAHAKFSTIERKFWPIFCSTATRKNFLRLGGENLNVTSNYWLDFGLFLQPVSPRVQQLETSRYRSNEDIEN
ncbi:hypothetical protein B0H16DRAFT_1817221 [Mycena metata]|uniref:MYND-type domain-containing protein n=1 Tax=Mycena metata TaxID=1033252 RepID=A0AAD7K941_9AGAR|nr:hypothetical protein B0H16DRAFT_1817221 [Mycena metata]